MFLLLCVSCEKLEEIPPITHPFRPPSGVELITVDSIYLFEQNSQNRVQLNWTTHLEHFPDSNQVHRTVIYRNADLYASLMLDDPDFTDNLVFSSQTYTYQIGFSMKDGFTTELTEPYIIITD